MGSRDFVSLSLPSTKSVGRGAFAFSTIEKVHLPDCKFIEAGAFGSATRLTVIESLDKVEKIETGAFYKIGQNRIGTQSVPIALSLPSCKQIGDHSFDDSGIVRINVPVLQEIGKSAFFGSKLQEIHLPNCHIINHWAFQHCDNLSQVVLSNHLTYIGHSAFGRCKSLNEVMFHGTIAEWQSITKESPIADTPLLIHCTDGIYTETPHADEP